MGLLVKFQEYRKGRQFRQYLKSNEWHGLILGDIVAYKNRRVMYLGINKNGGPGMAGFPEPVFGPVHPNNSECVYYYLRSTGEIFPEDVFGENRLPVQVGNTGVSIGFLNAKRLDFKKVDHITPEQWKSMATA